MFQVLGMGAVHPNVGMNGLLQSGQGAASGLQSHPGWPIEIRGVETRIVNAQATAATSSRARPSRTNDEAMSHSFRKEGCRTQGGTPGEPLDWGYSMDTASPPSRVARARQTAGAVPEENARTDPSAIAAFTAPGW